MDRSGTWWADGRLPWMRRNNLPLPFAGLDREEPFAVAHKVYLHTILQERNRDAAPCGGAGGGSPTPSSSPATARLFYIYSRQAALLYDNDT